MAGTLTTRIEDMCFLTLRILISAIDLRPIPQRNLALNLLKA